MTDLCISMDNLSINSAKYKLNDYAQAIRKNPYELIPLYYKAIHEDNIDINLVISTFHKANILDLNLPDYWQNEMGHKTTLLFSNLEFCNVNAVKLLLKLEANPYYVDESEFNAIDIIIWGYVNLNDTDSFIELLNVIMPFDIKMSSFTYYMLISDYNLEDGLMQLLKPTYSHLIEK